MKAKIIKGSQSARVSAGVEPDPTFDALEAELRDPDHIDKAVESLDYFAVSMSHIDKLDAGDDDISSILLGDSAPRSPAEPADIGSASAIGIEDEGFGETGSVPVPAPAPAPAPVSASDPAPAPTADTPPVETPNALSEDIQSTLADEVRNTLAEEMTGDESGDDGYDVMFTNLGVTLGIDLGATDIQARTVDGESEPEPAAPKIAQAPPQPDQGQADPEPADTSPKDPRALSLASIFEGEPEVTQEDPPAMSLASLLGGEDGMPDKGAAVQPAVTPEPTTGAVPPAAPVMPAVPVAADSGTEAPAMPDAPATPDPTIEAPVASGGGQADQVRDMEDFLQRFGSDEEAPDLPGQGQDDPDLQSLPESFSKLEEAEMMRNAEASGMLIDRSAGADMPDEEPATAPVEADPTELTQEIAGEVDAVAGAADPELEQEYDDGYWDNLLEDRDEMSDEVSVREIDIRAALESVGRDTDVDDMSDLLDDPVSEDHDAPAANEMTDEGQNMRDDIYRKENPDLMKDHQSDDWGLVPDEDSLPSQVDADEAGPAFDEPADAGLAGPGPVDEPEPVQEPDNEEDRAAPSARASRKSRLGLLLASVTMIGVIGWGAWVFLTPPAAVPQQSQAPAIAAPVMETAGNEGEIVAPPAQTTSVLDDLRMDENAVPARPDEASDANTGVAAMPEIAADEDLDLADLFLTDDPAPVAEVEEVEPTVALSDFASLAQSVAILDANAQDVFDALHQRDESIARLEMALAEIGDRAANAESLAMAQNQVLVRFVAAEEKLDLAEQLIVDLSRRIATLEGMDPADRADMETRLSSLEQGISGLQRDVGMVARMAINGAPAALAGRAPAQANFDHTNDVRPVSPVADPANVPADVSVGDFVNGYGAVLEIFATSDGGRMVVMENGSVIIN